MGKLIRADKYISELGLASRSVIKEGAKKGRLKINGTIVKKPEQKVDPDIDEICWDGQLLRYEAVEYYMLNKPAGVVSATKDNLHPTVLDLIEDKVRTDLFPVGRLDIDTEGLLLITNDGDLAHQLLSPRHHVAKVYQAEVTGTLPDDCVKLFKNGIVLKDGTETLPADLEILAVNDEVTSVRLSICEGKFHQVKRMFEAVDCQVSYLKRVSMGMLSLDPQLALGEYRKLTAAEIAQLKGKK